jgi:hypothetical protein
MKLCRISKRPKRRFFSHFRKNLGCRVDFQPRLRPQTANRKLEAKIAAAAVEKLMISGQESIEPSQ